MKTKTKTKTKQILSALLALLMLFGALPATVFAAEKTNPLDYLTYEIADGEVTITDCDTSISGELTIPETIEGYPVTGIGYWAFENCTDLTNVTIPDSVIYIGSGAFRDCTGLTNVKIPDSVISIGDNAFDGCGNLTSITIPNSITSIGNCTFESCAKLTYITIPNSVTSIGDHAFDGCTGLTGITIPGSVISIGDGAFVHCENLTSITIQNGVTNIGMSAFYGCSGLTNIVIPNSVTSIGFTAFQDCIGLTSVTIPDSVTSISEGVFADCKSLTSITIPKSVTSIGDDAFLRCRNLTSVTIPDSVTSIENNVFGECVGLTSIKVSKNNKVYDSRNNCNAIIETKTNKLISGCKNTVLPNDITSIGACAFYGCRNLTSITIPNSVTSIGSEAFYGCTGLISVTIPSSVTSIGESAFGYHVTFDDGEIKIPNFKIYCYAGTAGEQYAKDNGFEYEILKEECSHKLKHITVPASCTVNGMEYDLCTECGDTFNSKVIAALGHSWGNWYVSKQPTESADGEETRKCTRCSAIETRKIEKLKTVKDEKTGVEIIYKDEFENGVDLEVSQVFDGKSFQLISANYGDVKSAVFDISTYKEGVKVQPNGKIKVRIPLPQGFGGGNIFVCYVDSENGEVQKIKATVNGGYVEFEAEHFSEYAVVETAPSVKGVDIKDIKLTYKKSEKIKPNITADDGAKYTVKYESSNPKVASVDKNGKVTALKKGTAKITCTVTDSNGNTVSDTCNVTVKYNFGQWLIIILLFGWIWYI